jgi:hypothetical protein
MPRWACRLRSQASHSEQQRQCWSSLPVFRTVSMSAFSALFLRSHRDQIVHYHESSPLAFRVVAPVRQHLGPCQDRASKWSRLFFDVLVGLLTDPSRLDGGLTDPSRLDGGSQFAQVYACRKVGERSIVLLTRVLPGCC